MATRGTEADFNAIVGALSKITKRYESREIRHYQWAESIDSIFANSSWAQKEFYKELNKRLGIETNESREDKKVKVVVQKKPVIKKKSAPGY